MPIDGSNDGARADLRRDACHVIFSILERGIDPVSGNYSANPYSRPQNNLQTEEHTGESRIIASKAGTGGASAILSEDLVLEAGGRAGVPLSELNFHFMAGNRSSTGRVMGTDEIGPGPVG
jgi:hypothetical protein